MPQHVSIDDPDTEYFDGGCITVTCETGWLPQCSVDLLNAAQQTKLFSAASGNFDDASFSIDVTSDDVVCVRFAGANAPTLRIGRIVSRAGTRLMRGDSLHRRDTGADAAEPLNDADPNGADETPTGADLGTDVAPDAAASTSNATTTAVHVPVMVLEIQLDDHRGDAADPWVCELRFVRRLVHCVAFAVPNAAAYPLSEVVEQKYAVSIVDPRNPTQNAVGSMALQLQPRLLHVPLESSPNAPAIAQWRLMCSSASPPLPPPPADLVLAYSTRTTTGATGGEPLLPTATVNVSDKEKLLPGAFFEVFISAGSAPKDVLTLKFGGTQFVATSDGHIVVGREGNFGRLFASPQYIRVDVPAATKAATYRRLQQLLRCLHFKVDAESRDVGMVPGDRTVVLAVGEGKLDLFGRPEVTVSHFTVTVQDLPARRE
jgi:hypothetical protein